MLSRLPQFQTNGRKIGSRKSMLETLVRHLDMVRLTIAAAALLLAAGCSGLIDGGETGELSPEEVQARRLWVEKALPQLQANCTVCHDGARPNIEFTAGDGDLAKRDTILAYTPNVVNLDAPASSRVLTKGIHEGPALDATQTSDILEWIQAEKAALPDPGEEGPRLETSQFLPTICTSGLPDTPANPNVNCLFNNVPLDEIGAPGSKIQFIAQALGSGLYLTNLKLIPDPTMGALIDHPLFVSWPADGSEPKPDTIDRFFNVKMNLTGDAPIEEQQIAGGTAAFVGFLSTDKITIHFKAISPFVPDEGGPTGPTGCKELESFKANAQGTLNTNCGNCHRGQVAGATSAVNMTGVESADDATILNACNQIRTRVNFQDTVNSGILLAPRPGVNAAHDFKFPSQAAYDTFAAAMNVWIQAEVVAP